MAYWEGKPIAGRSDIRCSKCKTVFKDETGKWKFCPECGVSMQGQGSLEPPPTEKQLDFIDSITEFTGYKFTGTTKEEAREFISAHIEEFKLNSTNNWALEHGYL